MFKKKDIVERKVASTAKNLYGYHTIQGKLSDRLGVQKKVLKYFKAKDLEELDKKVTEKDVKLYMYFDEKNDRVAFIVVEDERYIMPFNMFMMMLGYRLNIGV